MQIRNLEIEKVIIESSILLVSIFSTIGLLTGSLTQQFKYAYSYLGYMLYYSFPFILACFWATVSYVTAIQSEETTSRPLLRHLAISSYICGFIMLLILASIAAQTRVLPENLLFLPDYRDLVALQIIVTIFILIVLIPKKTITIDLAEHRNLSKIFNYIASRKSDVHRIFGIAFIFILLLGFVLMSTGVHQSYRIVEDDTVPLEGRPNQSAYFSSFDLELGDQVEGKIYALDEDRLFSYWLMDSQNYELWNNSNTSPNANYLSSGRYEAQFSFIKTARSPDTYFLVLKSEYFTGGNVTYSLGVYKTELSRLYGGFAIFLIGVIGVIGVFTGAPVARNPVQ